MLLRKQRQYKKGSRKHQQLVSSCLGTWYRSLLMTSITPRLTEQILQVWLFQRQRKIQHAALPSRMEYTIVLMCTGAHGPQRCIHQLEGLPKITKRINAFNIIGWRTGYGQMQLQGRNLKLHLCLQKVKETLQFLMPQK